MTQQNSDIENDEKGPQFGIQRLYVKDLSLEVPNSPAIFLDKWDPKIHMDLGTSSSELEKDVHEVVLTVTVTVKLEEKMAALVEVKQAGIFTLVNFPKNQLPGLLGAFCPNLLYPYAREVITNTVTRSGFPQLYLAPINFDALFQQHEEERLKAQQQQAAGDVTTN